MSIVNVTNVVVLDNPTAFKNPLTFEVTFECLEALDAGKSAADGFAPIAVFLIQILNAGVGERRQEEGALQLVRRQPLVQRVA